MHRWESERINHVCDAPQWDPRIPARRANAAPPLTLTVTLLSPFSIELPALIASGTLPAWAGGRQRETQAARWWKAEARDTCSAAAQGSGITRRGVQLQQENERSSTAKVLTGRSSQEQRSSQPRSEHRHLGTHFLLRLRMLGRTANLDTSAP